jgi:hypothetical protein
LVVAGFVLLGWATRVQRVGQIEGHLRDLEGDGGVARENAVQAGMLLPVRLEAGLRGSL